MISLTIKETARRLDVTYNKLYADFKNGRIPSSFVLKSFSDTGKFEGIRFYDADIPALKRIMEEREGGPVKKLTAQDYGHIGKARQVDNAKLVSMKGIAKQLNTTVKGLYNLRTRGTWPEGFEPTIRGHKMFYPSGIVEQIRLISPQTGTRRGKPKRAMKNPVKSPSPAKSNLGKMIEAARARVDAIAANPKPAIYLEAATAIQSRNAHATWLIKTGREEAGIALLTEYRP